MTRLEHPGPVDGTRRAGVADARMMTRWMLGGFKYTSQHGTRAERLRSRTTRTVLGLLPPLAVGTKMAQLLDPRRHYYLSEDARAVLCVRVTRHGWFWEDFTAEQPGSGQGAALLTLVQAGLADQMTATHTHAYFTAATDRLATYYEAVVPGIVRVPGKKHHYLYCPTQTHTS